jgi:hypothetical protein
MTLDGRLIMRKSQGSYQGYRILTPNAVSDIKVTYMNSLAPVHVEKNGSLLCLAPKGIAWLKPGTEDDFTLDRELRIETPYTPTKYVGQTEHTIYLGTTESYLISIPKGDGG